MLNVLADIDAQLTNPKVVPQSFLRLCKLAEQTRACKPRQATNALFTNKLGLLFCSDGPLTHELLTADF